MYVVRAFRHDLEEYHCSRTCSTFVSMISPPIGETIGKEISFVNFHIPIYLILYLAGFCCSFIKVGTIAL